MTLFFTCRNAFPGLLGFEHVKQVAAAKLQQPAYESWSLATITSAAPACGGGAFRIAAIMTICVCRRRLPLELAR